MKIKTFKESYYKIDGVVNKWLDSNPNIEIKSTHQSVYESLVKQGNTLVKEMFIVLTILYRKKKIINK